MHGNRLALSLSTLAVLTTCALAQGTDGTAIGIGTRHKVRSTTLGENREVWVYTPDSVAKPGARLPVLYLLDGPAHFHHTTGIVQFLAQNERMPEAIVVGVANTNRTRDLTPHSSTEMDGEVRGGGADAFLMFLTDELAPWVDARYPTRPLRILVGHSFGGLFCVHALTKKPGFYQGLIAISPSMQWAKQKSVQDVEAWLATPPDASLQTALYLTVGNEGMGLLGGTMKLSGLLSEKAPKGLRWHFRHMPEETHGSVPHRSTYDGLEWLFDGWTLTDPLAVYDSGGWAAITRHYERVRSRFAYDDGAPSSAAMTLAGAMFSANRHRDIVALFAGLDPQRYGAPPMIFEMLANALAERDDAAGESAAITEGLRRFPGHRGMRARAKALGIEAPEAPNPAAPITISAKQLARYAGSYFVKPAGAAMQVTVVDDALHIQLPKANEPEVVSPKSTTSFRIPSTGMVVTFHAEGKGPAQAVTLATGGREFVCKREQ